MSFKTVPITAVDVKEGIATLELLKKLDVEGHTSAVAVNLHTLRKKGQDIDERRKALDECHVRRDMDGEPIPVCSGALDPERYAGAYTDERKYKTGAITLHQGMFFEAQSPQKGNAPAAGDNWKPVGRAMNGFLVRDGKAYSKDVADLEAETYDVPLRMIPIDAIEKTKGRTGECYWFPMLSGVELPDLEESKPWEVGDPVPEPHYCDDELPAPSRNGKAEAVEAE